MKLMKALLKSIFFTTVLVLSMVALLILMNSITKVVPIEIFGGAFLTCIVVFVTWLVYERD